MNTPQITFAADDFGLSIGVNEAVAQAHLRGVLTQASLMVAAAAAADAVARAKALPTLHTGLHLVLVDGDSCLGHKHLPTITLPDGRFAKDQAALGIKYFVSRAARRELAAEIRAQYTAFAATGLPLHHADAHKHMHLHPTVARLMINIGREFGLTRIRIPAEPPRIMKRCGATMKLADYALYAWTRVLRHQARRLATTEHVFGLKWSGHMTLPRIRLLLEHLPPGSSEIYFHPATHRDPKLKALMPEYEHESEFATLISLAGS